MKYLNFAISIIMFVMALWLTIAQAILTHSIIVAGALMIITAMMGWLVSASWNEIKGDR